MIEEIIGYVASVLVAISLTMSSLVKLRIINLVGAITFVIYGLMLPAYPVAFVNFLIALINIYYLCEIFSKKEYFTLLEVDPFSDYAKHFVQFYYKDIKEFFPEFCLEEGKSLKGFFALRDMVPAGLFIVDKNDENELNLVLDYVIPGYRDLKVGKFIYNQKQFLQRKIVSSYGSQKHNEYLIKMGFKPREENGKKYFILSGT